MGVVKGQLGLIICSVVLVGVTIPLQLLFHVVTPILSVIYTLLVPVT